MQNCSFTVERQAPGRFSRGYARSNVISRILGNAVETDLKVQVVAGGMTGGAHHAQDIALVHILALLYGYPLGMAVEGPVAVAVIYDTVITVTAAAAAGVILAIIMGTGIADQDNGAGGCCADLCAADALGPDIDTLMVSAPSPAHAVGYMVISGHRPGEL